MHSIKHAFQHTAAVAEQQQRNQARQHVAVRTTTTVGAVPRGSITNPRPSAVSQTST